MNRVALIIGILILIGAALFFANSNRQAGAPLPSPTPKAMEQQPTAEPTVVKESQDDSMEKAETKAFVVTGRPFSFDPVEMRVKKGDKVTITFKNAQGTHNFAIDEFNAQTEIIQTGQTGEVTFVADKIGTFEYYCGVGNHRQQGMVGNLIVE